MMASRLSVVLASRAAARIGVGCGGRARASGQLATTACASPLLARGPDRPDIPSRHPDIWPPGNPMPDSNVPDPLNPDPDIYPPDVGVPRRDSDVVPPRYPSPDIYPPVDTPDMPEPPVPGKGPFMAQHFAWAPSAAAAVPQDSPKGGPSLLYPGWVSAPAARALPALGRRSGGFALPPPGLLKTDGGNAWMEARHCGLHSTAAPAYTATQAAGGGAGRSLSEEDQEAANRTRAAMEGSQKQDDAGTLPSDAPDGTSAGPPRVSAQGSSKAAATGTAPKPVPSWAQYAEPGLPQHSGRGHTRDAPPDLADMAERLAELTESLPGFSQAAEPVSHIGKIGDDSGDVPEATSTGSVKPKVGPKASPGTPLEVPVEVPKPGFPK